MRWAALALVACVACGEDEPKINEQLAAAFGVAGIKVESTVERGDGSTRVIGTFTQPVDHFGDAGTFEQRVWIYHVSFDAPAILETEGYAIGSSTSRSEPAYLIGANEAQVEHRGYGYSTFDGLQYVSFEQAAADHHALVEALHAVYSGPWLAVGASKGGIAALAYRHFYPTDVAGVVAYVAPRETSERDPVFPPFVDALGDDACQASLRALQRDVLTSPRREKLVASLADALDEVGASYDLFGADRILELAAREERFTFWQYGSAAWCSDIPDVASSDDDDVLRFLDETNYFVYNSDAGLRTDLAYGWQSATQLGYPMDDADALADVVRYRDPETPRQWLSAVGVEAPAFDGNVTSAIAAELAGDVDNVVLIYGENDPWTAGAYASQHTFIAPGGNHYATMAQLSDSDRATAEALVQSWVTPLATTSIEAAATDRPERFD